VPTQIQYLYYSEKRPSFIRYSNKSVKRW